jgi:hypothetical protein
MSEQHVTDSPAAPPVVACSDLLAAMEQAFRDRSRKLNAQINEAKDGDEKMDLILGVLAMEESAEALADYIQQAANGPSSPTAADGNGGAERKH